MSKEAGSHDKNHKDFKQQVLMPKPAMTLDEIREAIAKALYDVGVIEFQLKFDHPRRLRELYKEINTMDKEAQRLLKIEQKLHQEKMEAMKKAAEEQAKASGQPMPEQAMKLADVPPSILAAVNKNADAQAVQ